MTFWDRVIYDSKSFFEGRKWWQNVLFFVPWALLALVGVMIWVFRSDKKLPDYANQAKNDPLDIVNASYEASLRDIEARRKELQSVAAQKERELIDSMTKFKETEKEITDASHEGLTKILYGKKLR